ncbi:acylphosphatase [Vibrio quintilis]|uniref:acylphosphatase n=1 Tax=Vibrio quintilis TaxID=1117707 RepID=A0A1M7YUR9_9VIBR|nr:acylphosphatase [Vibrio quintilis]SHO56427.1 Acylphosphatase [Vibrio quintilis]
MVRKTEIYVVKGIVQCVGFRYYTSHKAMKLGLTGYAKNLNNGDVEVVASGDESRLEQLFEWLHQGSPGASVSEVSRTELKTDKVYQGFAIQ